jgi:hypothetical protein
MDELAGNPRSPLTGKSIEEIVARHHCPHLGLVEDRVTVLAFPDYANRCHRHGPGLTVSVIAQEHLCLTPDYANCSVYQEPERIDKRQKQVRLLSRPVRALALVTMVAFILLAAVIWWPGPGRSILDGTIFSATLSPPSAAISTPVSDLAPILESPITSRKDFYKPVDQIGIPDDDAEGSSGFSVVPYGDD